MRATNGATTALNPLRDKVAMNSNQYPHLALNITRQVCINFQIFSSSKITLRPQTDGVIDCVRALRAPTPHTSPFKPHLEGRWQSAEQNTDPTHAVLWKRVVFTDIKRRSKKGLQWTSRYLSVNDADESLKRVLRFYHEWAKKETVIMFYNPAWKKLKTGATRDSELLACRLKGFEVAVRILLRSCW